MIYDRVEFCEKIIEMIENSDETSAFILYAQVGVGKSAVCRKIEHIINNNKNKKVIRVSSAQKNNNPQEGIFVKNIFKSLVLYFDRKSSEGNFQTKRKYKKYRLSTYIRKKEKWSTISRCIIETLGTSVPSLNKTSVPFYVLKFIVNFALLKLGIAKEIKDDSLYDYKLICDYIRYVLDSGNIILNIDNIQNFDRVSLDYFLECLIDTKDKNNFMLLEFTLLSNHSNFGMLNTIKKELTNADIFTYTMKLENLEISNVIKFAQNYCNSKDDYFETAIRNNYERFYKGNLKKVEDFASLYCEDISLEINPSLERLKNLSSNRKYILAIVIINNAVIKTKTLRYIIQNTSNEFMINFETDVIEFCKEQEFIEQADDVIKIMHSNTVDVWYENINIFKKYELVAYRNCQKIYNRILRNELFHTLSKKECLLLLFQLYNKFEIDKINGILFQIDEIIYDFLSVDDLYKYLRKIIDSINHSKAVLDYLYKIMDICIRFQMYDMEGYCLLKISDMMNNTFSEKYNFYLYTKMFQGEEYEELLELIYKNNQLSTSREFQSYSILFEIATRRALNHSEKCSEAVRRAETDKNFQDTVHYAYFLRLAEAYDKRNIAIPKVEQSIVLFQNANLPVQVAKSQVSLAFLYAITGNVDSAKNVLDSAEKVLLKNIENKYVFQINMACIQLLRGDYSEATWELLDSVEKCTRMKFDRIAITINKIIWCIENSNFVRGNYLVKKGLELLDSESDRHLHAIFYYNCYVLSKASGDLAKQQNFYNLAYKNRHYCETLTARLEGKDEVADNTTFLLSLPWHVCFVSYWYFDYLDDLT